MIKKTGKQSIRFAQPVNILSTASVVGPKEGEGPLKDHFDLIIQDVLLGEDSWEKAESKIVKESLALALMKSQLQKEKIDYILSGDLLNQSIGSTFGVREMDIPFFGVFGACSTFAEAMSLGAILIDGGFATNILVNASSHFCAAEKQFRFPLELGTQRPPSATWTVTGSGAAVLTKEGEGPYIQEITTGKIVDLGITDMNNMGAAMAPAAADTLISHFQDFQRQPSDYDVIATGDLGYIGHQLVVKMLEDEGYDMSKNYTDCGIEIYDREKQDTHSGGSGCACAATTFSGYFYNQLKNGQIHKILFVPTGALLSPTSSQQGESIPGIAHAVVISQEA